MRRPNLRQIITMTAFSMLDIPYVLGGQTNAALDCSGFLVQLIRRLGYNIDDMTADGLFNTIFILEEAADYRGTIQALFIVENGVATHVALVLNDDLIVDASEFEGMVKVRPWNSLTKPVRRFADMSYLLARSRNEEE